MKTISETIKAEIEAQFDAGKHQYEQATLIPPCSEQNFYIVDISDKQNFEGRLNTLSLAKIVLAQFNEHSYIKYKINNEFHYSEYIAARYDENGIYSKEDYVDFESCIFNEVVTIKDCRNINGDYLPIEISFANSIFKKPVYITGHTFESRVTFANCIFEKDVDFSGSTFNEKTTFHATSFRHVKFDNVKFLDLVDFWKATFNKPIIFDKVDFIGIAIFSEVTFKSAVQFIYCKTESSSVINFIDTKFHCALDISRANFNCLINFWNAQLIDDKGKEKYLLTDTELEVYQDRLTINNTQVLKNLRESFRIIKKSLRADENFIEASKMNIYELDIYHQELSSYNEELATQSSELGSTPIIIKALFWGLPIIGAFIYFIHHLKTKPLSSLLEEFFVYTVLIIMIFHITKSVFKDNNATNMAFKLIDSKSNVDKFITGFNKVTNNHGTSPLRAIVWLLFVPLPFHVLFSLNFNADLLIKIISSEYDLFNYIKFINLSDWEAESFGLCEFSNWQYFILFTGRIIISILLYQAIKSFRKFANN